ncbi:MAG: tRNA (N6-threonylcarbamoyladenosine(37)-N6)-methyltransferase TrmO [Candidatus Heimdallarchaeota archaeon]
MRSQQRFFISPIGYIEKENDEKTSIIVYEAYKEALLNIEFFSHLIILWWITGRDHTADRAVLQVWPKDCPNAPLSGVFTCRAPSRPNPIGISIVILQSYAKQANRLVIDRIDAFHGTPVIDIKPYFPSSDSIRNVTLPDWFEDLGEPRVQ